MDCHMLNHFIVKIFPLIIIIIIIITFVGPL